MECFEIMFFPFVLVVTSVPCVWGTLLRAWPAGDGAAHEGQKDTLLAVGSGDPLLHSLVNNVPTMSPETKQKFEAEVFNIAQGELKKVAKESGECVSDYTSPCPKGWIPRPNHEVSTIFCDAPKDYAGYCETFKSFAFYTENAKAEWARSCQVEWPCKGSEAEICPKGARDFSWPCPEGFREQPDGHTCEAEPGAYSGMCPLVANFRNFSDDAKRSWSETCGAFWPCESDCVETFESYCPEGWSHAGNFWCKAPVSYDDGRCDKLWNFKHFTKDMKREFQNTCRVHFPCENTCEKDYMKPCPKDWKQEGSICQAPSGYVACSVNRISFTQVTVEEKRVFEQKCDVEWPCIDFSICEVDWNLPCPEGWAVKPPSGKSLSLLIAENNFMGASCDPPSEVVGDCARKNVQFASEVDKRKWASMCNSSWPCKVSTKDLRQYTPDRRAAKETKFENFTTAYFKPRPPTPITDVREKGRQGSVHERTGEIVPRLPRLPPHLEKALLGKVEATPHVPPSLKTLTPEAIEAETRRMMPHEVKYTLHKGYYGGLTSGYHLLGSSV